MRYLKLFEDFENEKSFSITFDESFYQDVVSGLKKHGIKWENVDSLYQHFKKRREIKVFLIYNEYDTKL